MGRFTVSSSHHQLHLFNGEDEDVSNILNMLNFMKRKRLAFVGCEIFIEHLVATNMERPDIRRNG